MFKRNVKFIFSMIMCVIITLSFSSSPVSTNVLAATSFSKGADIGWLNQLESMGVKWQNDSGVQQDPLQILKDHGIDSIRLRVFVNPPSNFQWNGCLLGYSDSKGVIYMAQRAKKLGMKIMIDFHYSDHFADPGRQDMPAAWASHSFSQLQTDVYSHTSYVMNELKKVGIYPEWVQVGNETNGGMMWPAGSSSNFGQWSQLINQGYNAVKAVSPSSKVIIHLANGPKNSLYRYVFDGLKNAGAKYDVIGFSYYPHWDGVDYTQSIDALAYNLNDMASRYGKEVMVCEVGGHEGNPSNTYNMIKAVISKVQAVPNGKGLGVFYWEPEANTTVLPDKYPLGATTKVATNVLKFTTAIDAFK
ncbi:glycoside hydrolase family 53 protein [Clostridium cellulovorans]|uniref:Arabinogalactan endo-beta-1,4-galactanase n=2 Tax=Clostridium cellulovorans TaxID=1493 RepID=D9SUC2_CLOC7|nr:arabinogalactan endo-1,4-beta-galactosidase [Clostridium cellulovorans]ADL52877.1 Arabinogalactan endo-1,4-beta-galactosidase [Clostridium cellulovorans 743B]